MKYKILIGIIAACLALVSIYVAQRPAIRPEAADVVPFAFSSEDFGEVRRRAEKKVDAADDAVKQKWPVDAPAHRCYDLEARRPLPALKKGARYFFPAYSLVCIIPTSDPAERDFAAAYPNFSGSVTKIKKLVRERPTTFRQFDDLFDFPYNNAGWTFKSKTTYLDFPKVTGVFFLTQYSNGMLPSLANNEELTANFQGITTDGLYYVAARFSTTHPSLPKGIDFVDKSIQIPHRPMTNEEMNEYERQYLKKEGEKVDALRDDDFKPSLTSIKKLISSISIQ